jgi:tetratricopeptide (TPR) repeat protein
MRFRVVLILAFFTLATTGWRSITACLWDYDTLRQEARGMPGVIEAITGRFDRYPPLYYEMRLERVTKLLEGSPDDLDAYDGAAVACDRLGDSDGAIEWMARKSEVIDRLEARGEDTGDHRYRYLANLGTFHAHRWIRNGADRADPTDLERARDLIAEAIELNPDAHFGRERYQLLAIDWLLDPPDPEEIYFHETTGVPSIWMADPVFQEILGGWYSSESALVTAGYDDAVDGLTGLIVLGDAWQSVDVFAALACALLDQGDHNVAYVANLRCAELNAAGHASLHPAAGADDPVQTIDSVFEPEEINAWYTEARREADAWREARQCTRAGLRRDSQHQTRGSTCRHRHSAHGDPRAHHCLGPAPAKGSQDTAHDRVTPPARLMTPAPAD